MVFTTFDIKNFIEDMKACKPPYKCPFDYCGKVYKTYKKMHSHLTEHQKEANTPKESKEGRSPTPPTFFRSPQKETLVYTESQKMLEFEADNRRWTLSIFEPLEIMSKDDFEATLPPPPEPDPLPQEDPKATLPFKPIGKKGFKMKTPKIGTPKPVLLSTPSQGKEEKLRTQSEALNRTTVDEKKPLKLPEASFRILDDYEMSDAPPMPNTYYQFVEKSAEELDKEVEYDMDEEDVAWLELINEKRVTDGLSKVKMEQFELLMDRLEKESYFHIQSNGKDAAPIDDDAVCCVCMDGECSNTNVILFCDLCNLAVHQECYGVPYIPEGQWLCRRCLQSPSRSVECCLCPNRGGAFKQTDDGRWAHVVCGLWIPEVRFANTVFLEPIDSIGNIPPARWKLCCKVCKQRGMGACIQCHKTNCYTAMHVTCGLQAGLHMKMDTVRETGPGGTSESLRKTAYCDVHTPADSDCKPNLEDVASLGINTPKQRGRSPKKPFENSPVPILFRGLHNFSPQCPWEKVQKIASLVNLPKKNQFFQRLMAYWTLKRQTRNGVPLIRRLQFAKASKQEKSLKKDESSSEEEVVKEKVTSTPAPMKERPKKEKKEVKELKVDLEKKKAFEEFEEMAKARPLIKKLRHDLERVRLLCELIRKREQRKRELIIIQWEQIELKLFPFVVFLRTVLRDIQELDAQEIFSEPVDETEVPDYYLHVKKPMDLSTMRKKLENHQYKTLEDMESDFELMLQNCMSYNEKDTLFYRAAVKLRDVGGSIMRHAKRDIEAIGFDLDTGLHLPERAINKSPEFKDENVVKTVDDFIAEFDNNELPLEDSLKKLLEMYDMAACIKQAKTRKKRLKLLKEEIAKVRRKLAMHQAGTSPGMKHVKSGSNEEKVVNSNLPVTTGVKKRGRRKHSTVPVKDEKITMKQRLRGGKDENDQDPGKKVPGRRGRKRKRPPSDAEEKSTVKCSKAGLKTPVKNDSSKSDDIPAKSPSGVNRRNAVLFTRKMARQNPTPEPEISPTKTRGTLKKSRLNDAEADFKDEPETETKPVSKKPDRRKQRSEISGSNTPTKKTQIVEEKTKSPRRQSEERDVTRPVVPSMESFSTYRDAGNLPAATDDTGTDSVSDTLGESSEDETEYSVLSGTDESSTEGTARATCGQIPLEPLDLIWAKCRGYPWYPALIINPKMPRTGYFHNGVPIPVPPEDVLELAKDLTSPHYLILFFDTKRTWQWLPREKLEPLGVDCVLDKAKLVQSKKPSEKKAVKKAYEEAILHRCRVTGENATVSSESTEEEN